MSSSPYSTPLTPPPSVVLTVPARQTMEDMLRFYATAETRAVLTSEFEADRALLDELVERLEALIRIWRPATEWQWRHVYLGSRALEWLAWQVAILPDPNLVDLYERQAIAPYAIDLGTLPLYDSQPAAVMPPGADEELA